MGDKPASSETADNLPSRRMVIQQGLLVGMGLLVGGCASSGGTSSTREPIEMSRLPKPTWSQDRNRNWTPPPRDAPVAVVKDGPAVSATITAISRKRWASGAPVGALMDPMLPVRRVTLHHDGMNAFTSTSERAGAARVDAIRRSHRGKGWGDIGYHFAVDRAGRVWEGRPLRWQGAHVKDQNEHNIGVVALGNFEQQGPTEAQLGGVQRVISELVNAYGISGANLRSHQELAVTLCPGRNLQASYAAMRGRGMFG